MKYVLVAAVMAALAISGLHALETAVGMTHARHHDIERSVQGSP